MFQIFGVTSVLQRSCSWLSVHEVQMMKFELISHRSDLRFEFQMITFNQAIQSLLVVLVALLTNREYDISEVFRLTWVHFDQDAHFIGVGEHVHVVSFHFGVDVIAVPFYDVVSIQLAEQVRRVDLVLDYLLA